MNPIFQAAAEIEHFLTARGWGFCFIGGLAVLRWGEPRFTADVDLTLLADYGREARFVDEILEEFSGRLRDTREFALKSRVLLIEASNHISLDVSLGALPFEEAAVRRASPWDIGAGITLRVCSAEDLVVHKAFANRDQDWLDVAGVILRRGPGLDRQLILDELQPLVELKSEPEILRRLQDLFGGSP